MRWFLSIGCSGFGRFLLLSVLVGINGCSSIMNRATHQFANNLTNAILNQDDISTVKDGVPAYLLLVDGLVAGDPDNPDILIAGATLYDAYASGFVEDAQRSQRLSGHAYAYAKRGVCLRKSELCAQLDAPFDAFSAALSKVERKDLALVNGFATSWASKIQANASDWNAIADIPKVQALFERVLLLDPQYAHGEPAAYLGVLNSIRPASLGGTPEQGKAYFEQALELSEGKNQMVRVLYAEHYARLVFDQALHDRLLNDVLAADPVAPQLTLVNILAKQRAKLLLESGKDYF